ncbi:MAG: DUF1540 domain-containing protein [Sideroxyarcus sp.]|nr:DUF1540 domain-containing protein [Sideroxyarcus sp.]
MDKIMIEMPPVKNCMANECVYNANSCCHARAITIGDTTHPACDTFQAGQQHTHKMEIMAGIGACKTSICKFNDDFECSADSVQVGLVHSEANCMTFAMR